jgi:hypothetical protein
MSECDLRDEFVGCDFGDARLSKRVLMMAEVFENNPGRSIPSAFVTRADWEACYRFFDNEAVTPQSLVEPHIHATWERVKEFDVALLVQDTTELDLTRPTQQVHGAGPMDSDARRGAFFHPLMAFACDGVPLGLVGMQHWTRDAINHASPQKKHQQREAKPIEEKESYRWLVGLQQARETAEACPETTCVCIGDSESDIFELYALAHRLRADHPHLHLLVRAGQDRATNQGELWTTAASLAPLIATQSVHVRARQAKIGVSKSQRSQSREARTAEVQVRAGAIEVRCPAHLTNLPKSLQFNVVLVDETNPPEGENPIRWLLATTLPIDTETQIQRVIRYYCLRWQIEVFFRTLKSGCRIEYRRFEQLDRVMNCLAMLAVVAWRVMYVSYLGRACPDMDCETVFEPSEWKSIYAVLHRPIPKRGCPTLREVVRAIALLGGFVDRPSNQPGTQTVWTGLQRCYDLSTAWDIFGPGAKKISPT